MKAEGFGMKGPSFIGRQHSNSNSQGDDYYYTTIINTTT